MGIDGRIYPASAMPTASGRNAGELDFMDESYHQFEAVMMRSKAEQGLFRRFRFFTRCACGNERILPP
jgi:hypothetical protein